MSLSSTLVRPTPCGHCGETRQGDEFRCSHCGKILPPMLQVQVDPSARQHFSAQTASAGKVNLFARLFTSRGRLGRLQYFLANVILWGIQTLFTLVVLVPMARSVFEELMMAQTHPEAMMNVSMSNFTGPLFMISALSLFYAISYCFLCAQRSHDLGRSGYYSLFNFVPLLNIYWWVLWTFAKGQSGSNMYGPDPLA